MRELTMGEKANMRRVVERVLRRYGVAPEPGFATGWVSEPPRDPRLTSVQQDIVDLALIIDKLVE